MLRTVVGATSEDPGYFGRPGPIGAVAAGTGDWSGHDMYVSGPPAMVPDTVDRLRRAGVPLDRIAYDPITAG